MNPTVRHFLPSVIRGVYRADAEFSKIKADSEFQRFAQAKLRFLPPKLADELRRHLSPKDDFETTKRLYTLPDEQLDPVKTTAQRASAFFGRHAYFENATATKVELQEAENYLEIQFVRKVLAPLLSSEGLRLVQPQRKVGRYLVDFALEGSNKLAIEVDGFGKFKTRADLDGFTQRQNYITSQGWRVVRFTYSQIMETTGVTLRSLHSLLKEDQKLRGFLTAQWHTGWLGGLFARSAGPQAMGIVNDFYRVQDSFVEAALAPGRNEGPILLKDAFGYPVPFVALAISVLYRFLDAVQSVVEVEFELPRVIVDRCNHKEKWSQHLHELVAVSDVQAEGALQLDSETVSVTPALLPEPPLDAGKVRFREGLSLDQIRERLAYITGDVFGYPSGTKPFQDRILQRVFNRQHVLGISATGSGKSFCFWLPALLKPGLTLIICPLRSLMATRGSHSAITGSPRWSSSMRMWISLSNAEFLSR